MSNSAIRRVVTTVHGTYAKHATWGEPKSKLGLALTQRFGADVEVIPFRWSGKNNPAARAKAKDDLRAHLRTLHDEPQYKEASHYIIAHSHGGNVALYALCDEALRESIAGVACLATPFILSRQRVLGSQSFFGVIDNSVSAHVTGALAILFLPLVLLARWWLPAFEPAWLRELLISAFLALWVFGTFFLQKSLNRYAERLHRELQLAKLSKERLLIIRAPGDEASAALLFFQFVSEISVRFYVILNQFKERFRSLLIRWSQHLLWLFAALVGGFVLFCALIAVALETLKMRMGVVVIFLFAVIWLFIGVLTLIGGFFRRIYTDAIERNETDAIQIVAIPFQMAALPFQLVVGVSLFATIIVLSLTLLPFGWQVALSNIFYDITAETTPPGTWEVNLIEPSRSQNQTGDVPALEHSIVYEDKSALTLICDWIERTLKP